MQRGPLVVAQAARELGAERALERRRALLRPAAVRRLLDLDDELGRRAVLADRRYRQPRRQHAPVGRDEAALDPHRIAVDARARDAVAGQHVVGVAEVVEGHAAQRRGAQPEQRGECGVGLEQAAVLVGQRHRRRHLLEHRAEARIGLGARGLRAAAADERAEAHEQLLGRERLHGVVVGGLVLHEPAGVLRVGGEHDDGQVLVRAQGREHRLAAGAARIDERRVDRLAAHDSQRLRRRRGVKHLVVVREQLLEVEPEHVARGHEQHAREVAVGLANRRAPPPAVRGAQLGRQRLDRRPLALGELRAGERRRLLARRVERQLDDEQRSTLRGRRDRHRAAVQRDEVVDDGQAQSRPARAPVPRAVDLVEALEDRLALADGHARSRVGDLDAQPSLGRRQRAAHDPAGRRVAHGVGDQVRQHGPEPGLVHVRDQTPGRVEHEPRVALLEQPGEPARRVAHERGDVARRHPQDQCAAIDLRRLEQLLDVAQEAVGVGPDALEVTPLRRRARPGGEQPSGEPEDHRQRRLQLVARVGHQLETPRCAVVDG